MYTCTRAQLGAICGCSGPRKWREEDRLGARKLSGWDRTDRTDPTDRTDISYLSQAASAASQAQPYLFFTASEAAFIESAVDRLIPPDANGPSYSKTKGVP